MCFNELRGLSFPHSQREKGGNLQRVGRWKGGGREVVPELDVWNGLTSVSVQRYVNNIPQICKYSQICNLNKVKQIERQFVMRILWSRKRSLWKPVNLQVACTLVGNVPDPPEAIITSRDYSQRNDFTWWVTYITRDSVGYTFFLVCLSKSTSCFI